MKLNGAVAIFRASARQAARRPADLAGAAIFAAVLLTVLSALWRAAASGGMVHGWTVAQLVVYLLIAEAVTLSPGFAHVIVADDLRSGALQMRMLRPMNAVLSELSRALGTAFVRLIVVLMVGAPIALGVGGVPQVRWMGLLVGLGVLVPLAVVLETTVRVCLGLLAAWIDDPNPAYWVWQKASFALGGLMLPLDLYPAWLRGIVQWLPFRSLFWGPASTVVAFDMTHAATEACILVAWTIATLVGMSFAWRAAARRLVMDGG